MEQWICRTELAYLAKDAQWWNEESGNCQFYGERKCSQKARGVETVAANARERFGRHVFWLRTLFTIEVALGYCSQTEGKISSHFLQAGS